METKIRGALFDKDGTLFDFAATWNAWAQSMLRELAEFILRSQGKWQGLVDKVGNKGWG